MQKKTTEKLTNVSLYVCMSAGNSEILVFISVFSQQCAFFEFFNGRLGKKTENVSFYGVCMYVRPKLTFVSFYFWFILHLSLREQFKKKEKYYFSQMTNPPFCVI